MKAINLGGVGGCCVTHAIQNTIADQPRYPYDWLLSNQSFVIRTFMNNGCFFDWDDVSQLVGKEFRVNERDGLSVHDVSPDYRYEPQKNGIKYKYTRRFERLNAALFSDEPILFVRVSNHTPNCKEWEDRFLSVPDDFKEWQRFIQYVNDHFKKPIYFLYFTENHDDYEKASHANTEGSNIWVRWINKESEVSADHQIEYEFRDIYHSLISRRTAT
jgi:hypothetical protein